MLKDILKGAVIGVANIIPGVSGGTMAVSMGIYNKLISSVTNFRKDVKGSLKFLAPILIGAVFSIIALTFVITYMFENFPLQTNFLFIGLIVGGVPTIFGKVKGAKVSVDKVIAFLIPFLVVIGSAFLDKGIESTTSVDLTFNFINVVILFGVGIIAAATMVVPGVSGSMVLMLLGYYEPIIASIKGFIQAGLKWDVAVMIVNAKILIPAGIGMLVGIIVIAKLIEIVFQKWETIAYFAIIGLIVASPFAILMVSNMGTITAINVIVSIVMLGIGSIVAYKLSE